MLDGANQPDHHPVGLLMDIGLDLAQGQVCASFLVRARVYAIGPPSDSS